MKGIFKILSVGILLLALFGAMYLVRKNQETRRGAAANETSSSILPDKVTVDAGQNFSVHVWLNTGKDTDKLAGAEFNVIYDATKAKYIAAEPQNGYSILNDNVNDNSGTLTFRMVTLNTEKSGAVDLVKVSFQSLANAGGSLLVQQGKIMITGQSETWDIASNNPSNYKGAGGGPSSTPTSSTQKSCVTDADCAGNGSFYCYQPPKPTCAPGGYCAEGFPPKYCKACTPRLACMDAEPACMPDLVAGAPPFCPKANQYACGFCGSNCTRLNPRMDCPAVMPGPGTKCVEVAGNCVIQKATAGEGEMCGGFRGIMCQPGLECSYSGFQPGYTVEGRASGDTSTSVERVAVIKDGSGICVRPTALKCNWCGMDCVDSRMKRACKEIGRTDGATCVAENGACVIKPPTTGLQCGNRCGGVTGLGCSAGLTCTPIWWPCQNLPMGVSTKLSADAPLDATTVKDLISICPRFADVLPKNYVEGTSVKMPAYYGVCRNAKCPSAPDCACGIVSPTPTIPMPQCTPVLCRPGEGLYCPTPGTCIGGCGYKCGTPTPTPSQTSSATLELKFQSTTAKVGDEVWLTLYANAGQSKISSVNTKFLYDSSGLQYVDSYFDTRQTELKKNISGGSATLYYTINKPAGELPSNYSVANIKFKILANGSYTVKFDDAYATEVSGVNASGTSVGFSVPKINSNVLTVSTQSACAVCLSGAAKSTGNANCDTSVNSVDFEIWRSEMFDKGGSGGVISSTWQADFNCDKKVSGIDFEIWRKTVFN